MKISCNACGNKYDPVSSEGVCPHCGMRADKEKLSPQENVAAEEPSPRWRKRFRTGLCLLLTAAIAGVFVWGDFRYKERLEYYLTERGTSQMHTEEHRAGDTVVLVGGGNEPVSSNVKVLGCRVRDDLQSKVSGEFKIIEMEYEDTGTPIPVRLSETYLLTEDGCTARCLDKFDVMTLTGMTEEEYMDSDYRDGIFSSSGRGTKSHLVLFAAPKAETDHRVLMFRKSEDGSGAIEMRCDFILSEEDEI